MEPIVNSILSNMSSIKKPQRIFIASLLSVFMVFQGKATFRNMSRYSEMHEKRFSRWYRRPFCFSDFNHQLLSSELLESSEKIAAIDASFMQKSGQCTEGLGWFYNGKASKAEKGLEISLLSLVDIQTKTAYSLDVQQTIDTDNKKESRVNQYAKQIQACSPLLSAMNIRYLAADAYYTKQKFINTVCDEGLDMVGKLRIDARLQWLFRGSYSGFGCPKKYDGKVNFFTEKHRFDFIEKLENECSVYSKIVYSTHLKRIIRVVFLHWKKSGKEGHALLFSTDKNLNPMTLLKYYQSRFQIEFLFRDAKQHTGLVDCQALCKEAIHTHINASMTALNLLKLEDKKKKKTLTPSVISITSWKRKKFNQHLMKRLFLKLDLSLSCKKVKTVFDEFSDYGAITV
jgi:hypothetical protein